MMSSDQFSSLESLLADVGPTLLQALALPHGSMVRVDTPVLFDTAEGVVGDAGAVLLAVGCRPEDAATGTVLRRAADRDLAAVVIKSYGEDVTAAIAAAESAGIALLLAEGAVSWPHIHLMLSAAAAGDESERQESLPVVGTGDLFALANAVAAMVGGAIAIEDPHQHVLAYSNLPGQPIDEVREAGILGRRVPAEYRLADLYEQVRRANTVQRVTLPGIRPRISVAIRAGDEPIGSIWAVEGEGGFPAGATQALEDAARLASLHLLRLRATADVERTARSEALRGLLHGRPAPADVLPLFHDSPVVVVAFQAADVTDSSDDTLLTRAAELVTVYCESVHRMAACLTLGQTIYSLLPTGRDTEISVLRALVERLRKRACASLGITLRAGIGGVVNAPSLVSQSRSEADLVVQVLARRSDDTHVATIDELRSQTILVRLGEFLTAERDISLPALQMVSDHDAEKGTDYVATLRAYLDCFGDIPTASDRMFLHQNTFRHRMRRIRELFSLQLDDPDERLVLWLLLRVSLGGPVKP